MVDSKRNGSQASSAGIFRGIPWQVYAVALAAVIVSLTLCQRMLGGIPHIPDEISYVFQGRILASGHLWLPPPAVRHAFSFSHIRITEDRWCSIYPVGWPLILALGWLMHVPWIMNPLILGLTILGVWRLAHLIFDSTTAYFSILLFAVSPFVLLMSSGWMSHPSAMLFIVWSTIFSVTSERTLKNSHLLLASVLAGGAFLIRPLTAVAMVSPVFLWLLLRSRERKWRVALLLSCGIIPFVLIYLSYNAALFHEPILGGYLMDPEWHRTNGEKLTFLQTLFWYAKWWNQRAWEWPWPDLLLLLPAVLVWRSWSSNWWLIACPAILLFSYFFYEFHDIVYSGPRYIYEAMTFVAILIGRSLIILNAWCSKIGKLPARLFSLLFVPFLLMFPVVARLPQQVQYHSEIYHRQTREFLTFVKKQNIGKSALILLSNDSPSIGTFYFENTLRPEQAERVFVRDVPSVRGRVLREFPRRENWQLIIKLRALPGPNHYKDHFELEMIRLQPCCNS